MISESADGEVNEYEPSGFKFEFTARAPYHFVARGRVSVNDIFGGERVELSDVLNHILDKGVVLRGEVMLAVADIDLVRVDLGLLLSAVDIAMGGGRPPGGGASPLGEGAPRLPAQPPSGSTMESQVIESLHAPSTACDPARSRAEGTGPGLNTDPDKVENGLASSS